MSPSHQHGILEGVHDYYALDFQHRCLTERGTHPSIDRVLELDYPGHTLYLADSKHSRYSGASSFSEGELSSIRRGDWVNRNVKWTIHYPPGAVDYLDRTWHYLSVWLKVDVATCEPVRDSYSRQFYSVFPVLTDGPPEIYVDVPGSDCAYNPLRPEELGRRDDIDLRETECLQGHFSLYIRP